MVCRRQVIRVSIYRSAEQGRCPDCASGWTLALGRGPPHIAAHSVSFWKGPRSSLIDTMAKALVVSVSLLRPWRDPAFSRVERVKLCRR